MAWRFGPMLLLLAHAAPALQDRRHEQLMNEIEAIVPLPQRALPLDAYARYYAGDADTLVHAVYLTPSPTLDDASTCRKWTADRKIRPCTETELADAKKKTALARRLRAGQRRWEASTRDIPLMFDGGCRQITIDYDPVAKRFAKVKCNGYS